MTEALDFIQAAKLVIAELIAAELAFRKHAEQRRWCSSREWFTVTNLRSDLCFVATVDDERRLRLRPRRRGDDDEPIGIAELRLQVGLIPSTEPSALSLDAPRLFVRAMPFFRRDAADRFSLSTRAGKFEVRIHDNDKRRDVAIKPDGGIFQLGWRVSWVVGIFETLGRWLAEDDDAPRAPFLATRAEHALLRMLGNELAGLAHSVTVDGLAQIDAVQFDALGPMARRLGQYYQLTDLDVILGLRLDREGRPLRKALTGDQMIELRLSLQPSASGAALLLERSFAGLLVGERRAAAIAALLDAADALADALGASLEQELTSADFEGLLAEAIAKGPFIARYDLDSAHHIVLISGTLVDRPSFALFELQLHEDDEGTRIDNIQVVARRWGDEPRGWNRQVWPELGAPQKNRLHDYTSLLLRTLNTWA
jgi:hypothetical protein